MSVGRAALANPRNLRAAEQARSSDEALVVSFVGDTPWRLPTVYCDSGQRYDWSFAAGLSLWFAVKPGVQTLDAFPRALEAADVIRDGYPTFLDVEQRIVACIVHGDPIQLWRVRQGTALWLQYFPA